MQGAFLSGFVLLTAVLAVPVLHGFFAVQTLKIGELFGGLRTVRGKYAGDSGTERMVKF